MIVVKKSQPLIIISGPTASGKTATSILLAKFLNQNNIPAEVINFDSLLFYREISVGTAKPTEKEMDGVIHHLVGINSIAHDLNAADYIIKAQEIIHSLHQKKVVPILVGGSAFYLRALMKGMYQEQLDENSEDMSDEKKIAIKKKWKESVEKDGILPVIEYLKQHDPEALNLFHANDHYRLTRAAEHFEVTAKKISDQKKHFDTLSPYDFTENQHQYDFIHFYLDLDKTKHWEIILKRTKQMLADGLIKEIQQLLLQGFAPNLKPLQSIGYKETQQFLNNEIKTEEDLVERIAISTRQLAKSQRTFFKKITPKILLNPLTDHEKIKQLALTFLTEK